MIWIVLCWAVILSLLLTIPVIEFSDEVWRVGVFLDKSIANFGAIGLPMMIFYWESQRISQESKRMEEKKKFEDKIYEQKLAHKVNQYKKDIVYFINLCIQKSEYMNDNWFFAFQPKENYVQQCFPDREYKNILKLMIRIKLLNAKIREPHNYNFYTFNNLPVNNSYSNTGEKIPTKKDEKYTECVEYLKNKISEIEKDGYNDIIREFIQEDK